MYLLGIVLYMYISLCMVLLWIALVLRIPYFNFKTFLVIEEPEIEEEHLKLLDEKKRAAAENAIGAGHYGYGSTESLIDSYNRQSYHQQQNAYDPVYQPYHAHSLLEHQQQQQQQNYQSQTLELPQQPQASPGPSQSCLEVSKDLRQSPPPAPSCCNTSRDYQ